MTCGCARFIPTSPSTSGSLQIAPFSGTNAGYQKFVTSPGPTSEALPYVEIASSSLSGFAGSINDKQLPAGQYSFDVCKNVISDAVVAQNILATITLTVTTPIVGTLKFTSLPSDVGPHPTYISIPGGTYQLAPATVTWTTVLGSFIVRDDSISLFLSISGGAKTPASAQYQIYLLKNV